MFLSHFKNIIIKVLTVFSSSQVIRWKIFSMFQTTSAKHLPYIPGWCRGHPSPHEDNQSSGPERIEICRTFCHGAKDDWLLQRAKDLLEATNQRRAIQHVWPAAQVMAIHQFIHVNINHHISYMTLIDIIWLLYSVFIHLLISFQITSLVLPAEGVEETYDRLRCVLIHTRSKRQMTGEKSRAKNMQTSQVVQGSNIIAPSNRLFRNRWKLMFSAHVVDSFSLSTAIFIATTPSSSALFKISHGGLQEKKRWIFHTKWWWILPISHRKLMRIPLHDMFDSGVVRDTVPFNAWVVDEPLMGRLQEALGPQEREREHFQLLCTGYIPNATQYAHLVAWIIILSPDHHTSSIDVQCLKQLACNVCNTKAKGFEFHLCNEVPTETTVSSSAKDTKYLGCHIYYDTSMLSMI